VTAHEQLSAECTRDLRRHRATEQHRRARAPIISRMNEMRCALGFQPFVPPQTPVSTAGRGTDLNAADASDQGVNGAGRGVSDALSCSVESGAGQHLTTEGA
jgi:hypothetical protein